MYSLTYNIIEIKYFDMAIEELKKLEALDFTKQLTFAYLTCERLFPNYVYFAENFDFGEPTILREAIDFLYLNIFEKNIDKNKIDFFVKKVEKNTPDTEDFSTIFVSSALDVCTCILDSLDFLADKQLSHLKSILSYATDSVDMYVREIENIEASDKDFMKKVNEHPLMKKEISVQQGIIAFLCNTISPDYGDIQTLLHLQDNNNKSNLGL